MTEISKNNRDRSIVATKAVILLLVLLQGHITSAFVHPQNKKIISCHTNNNKRRLVERNYRYDDDGEEDETVTKKKLSQKLLSPFKIKYRSYKEKRRSLSSNTKNNDSSFDFTTGEGVPTSIIANNSNNNMRNVHELRDALFNEGLKLEQIDGTYNGLNNDELQKVKLLEETLSHEVLKILSYRYQTKSKPGQRHVNDTATLALSIEGGGMRGAVSAGMAAAIGCLGLCDTFDSIYGSSAGSVIGAYMVSRQLCVDVYTDLLVAAKKTFVSKMRIFNSLISSLISNKFYLNQVENERLVGMNISFVLDGILSSNTGLRPLDIDAFNENNKVQPLHIVSSVIRNDTKTKLDTICYNSKDGDFSNMTKSIKSGMDDRYGLFACLQASMTVPGAAGPPVQILRAKDNCTSIHHSFDAFCFEPIPYRSAVKDGATHVLVLRSRPDGSLLKTKPGVYEKTIAPLYFKQNKLLSAAKYFKKGGQQFRYLEDFMTLDEGLLCNEDTNGVLVPPTDIIYGASKTKTDDNDPSNIKEEVDVNTWKRAHLLPIVVPRTKPELPALEQGQDEVLNAVRDGFAAAFDILAPIVISDLDKLDIADNGTASGTTVGDRVAELIFPRKSIDNVLEDPVHVKGEIINGDMEYSNLVSNKSKSDYIEDNLQKQQQQRQSVNNQFQCKEQQPLSSSNSNSDSCCSQRDARTLLSCLPGLKSGKLSHIADGLHWHIRS